MKGKLIAKGDRSFASDNRYDDKHIGIVIPDYKRRYGFNEADRKAKNLDLLRDLKAEFKKLGLKESDFILDFEADCGMGLDFPVVALLITAGLALPAAIASIIDLVERIKEKIKKKREQSKINGTPSIGMPIFDPRILEKYCYEVLRKEFSGLINAGGDFEHVVTIDTSFKPAYYQYGVVYMIIFRSSLLAEPEVYPHWAIRITCTGELLSIQQVLSEQHISPHLYIDDEDSYKKATGEA